MVDERYRIRRILYAANIRKLFTYIKRFEKPKEDPFAAIKSFLEIRAERLEKPGREEIKFKGKTVRHRTPILRFLIIMLTFVIFVGVGFYVFTNIKITPAPKPLLVVQAPTPIVNINVHDSGIINSYDGIRFYSILTINGSILDYVNISMPVFRDFAPEDVFILRSIRKEASRYNEFKRILKTNLEMSGFSVAEITIDDLMRMPNTSKITLIVPAGYMPTVFFGMEDPNFDIIKFTQRGNVVIYIGRAPTTDGVIARDGSIISLDINKTESLGLMFVTEGQSFDKFTPLYRVQFAGGRQIVDLKTKVGSASATWGGGGYVYFLPTTLDGWWGRSGGASAVDISEIVANANWGYYYISGNTTINATNNMLNSTSIIIFTDKFTSRNLAELINQTSYGRLLIKASKYNDTVSSGKMVQLQFKKIPNGRINNIENFVASSITGEELDLEYSLNEPILREDNIFLYIINKSGIRIASIPLGVKSLKLAKADYRLNAAFQSGDYILRIVDSMENTLAQSYLHLSPFSIEPQSLGWELKMFIFNVYPEGESKTPYAFDIKPVKISIDGRDEKEIRLTAGRLTYEPSFFPSPGPHTFKFVIGNDTVIKVLKYEREPSFLERYWYMILTVIVVFVIAFVIRRPERIDYFVDVPDFPPLRAIAIPVKRYTVIEMFDSINKELRWQYTPLSLQDLKAAFRKMSFQGRPIIVGDYNLEHILDKMVEEGLLKKALDYYGLVSWEKEAKKSIYRLAMQRALRDLFVIEGIPFIPFGQRTDCDTIVNVGGEKVFLHIYEDDTVIYRAVQTAPQGRTIIIFEDEQTMKDFTTRVHSSSETNVIFKMLLDDPNGNIFLSPIAKLIDVLNKKYSFFYY